MIDTEELTKQGLELCLNENTKLLRAIRSAITLIDGRGSDDLHNVLDRVRKKLQEGLNDAGK